MHGYNEEPECVKAFDRLFFAGLLDQARRRDGYVRWRKRQLLLLQQGAPAAAAAAAALGPEPPNPFLGLSQEAAVGVALPKRSVARAVAQCLSNLQRGLHVK